MRVPLVAGNWKMNTTVPEAAALVDAMLNDLPFVRGVETVLCPPFVSLDAVRQRLMGTSVLVGAQSPPAVESGTGPLSGKCRSNA